MNVDAGVIAAIVGGFNIAITLIGGGVAYGRVSTRLDTQDENRSRIEQDVKEIKTLLITSAVEVDRLRRAEADIQNLEEDVRRLRRGIGFINDDSARSVNREY